MSTAHPCQQNIPKFLTKLDTSTPLTRGWRSALSAVLPKCLYFVHPPLTNTVSEAITSSVGDDQAIERYQLFLARGNDLFVEGRVRMTPDTIIVEDGEGKLVAEFYREGVIGWKRAGSTWG